MNSNAITFIESLWQQGLELWLEGDQLGFRGNKKLLTAETIEQLKEFKAEIIDYIAKEPLAFQGFPLSEGQKGIYLSQQLAPNSPLYNLSCCLKINSPVDTDALQSALNTLTKRHPALTASFHETATHISQMFHLERAIALQLEKISADTDLKQWLNKRSDKSFLLGSDTLLKAFLVEQGDSTYLTIVTHHIIADFWGLQAVLKDLQNCYQALLTEQAPPEIPEKASYKNFVLKEKAYLNSEKAETAKQYWQFFLQKNIEPIEIPQYQTRPRKKNFQGDEYIFQLPKGLSKQLKQGAKNQGVTPFIWLLSCYQCWLCKMSGANDLAIGIPVANRGESHFQNTAGHFTNPLPIFNKRTDCTNFTSLLQSNKKQLRSLLKFQQYPNELIQNENNNNALYQTAFSWNQLDENAARKGLLFNESLFTLQRGALLDLVLTAVDKGNSIELAFRFNSDIFNSELMRRFSTQLTNIVSNSLDHNREPFTQPFISEQEQRRLTSINETDKALPKENNIAALIENAITQYADNIAIIEHDNNYSYEELGPWVNGYIKEFSELPIKSNSSIAIHLPRGLHLVASAIAAMKLGHSFTPIDTSYPFDRITHMLNSCDSEVLVLSKSKLSICEKIQELDKDLHCVFKETIKTATESRETAKIDPQATACVLFTSGSTGKPKAVAIPHQAIIRLSINNGFLELKPEQKMCYLSNISFDASNIEIWNTLFHGATLLTIEKDTLLSPKLFTEFIEKYQPDTAMITTALFNALIDFDSRFFHNFDTVMIGGEAASLQHIKKCLENGKPHHLFNLYGPTENGTVSTACELSKISDFSQPVAIGHPISNSECFIVDPENMLCPIGVKGELLTGGKGLATGYLKQHELSSEKFIDHLFSGHGKLYRTGDIAYINGDNLIYYTGREDDQVKIRGFRIELGEIEHHLTSLPSIKLGCIDVRRDKNNNPFLAAFYTGEKNIDSRAIKQYLEQKLPDFMVPQVYKQLETFNITANGKLDRKSLPEVSIKQKPFVAPSSDTEKALADIFKQSFSLTKVSIHDNFFDLGGHSLLAVKIAGKLQKQFDIDINMRLIFENPDIEKLSKAITSLGSRTKAITHIEASTEMPAALSQQRLWFLQQLDNHSTAYNMPIAIEFERSLQSSQIKQILKKLFARHDALSYRFIDNNGTAHIEKADIDNGSLVNDIDLRQLSEKEQQRETQKLIDRLGKTIFKLDQGPLFKCLLIRLGEQKTLLAFCLHHIISDGWSVKILLQELGLLLQDPNHKLPPNDITYMDYSLWQHNLLRGDYLEQQLGYWKQQLQSAEPTLNLPLDKPRPAFISSNGGEVFFSFDYEQSQNIRHFSQQHNATTFMVLIAAYSFLLSRYSGSNDICIGFPISGREQSTVEPVVGLFVNNLVLRHEFNFNNSVNDFIASIKQTTLAAYSHQAVPFDMIIDSLNIERSLSYTPFLQASFSLEEASLEQGIKAALGDDITLRSMDWHVAKYDIHLSCFDSGNGTIDAQIEYNRDLFEKETIERIAEHFQTLTSAITNNTGSRLSEINFLSKTEISEQLSLQQGLNATQFEYPRFNSIQAMFEQQEYSHGEKFAVTDDHAQLRFSELNEKSNNLAHYLRDHGVGRNEPVAVIFHRCVELSIALMGILKSGGCYVPISPETPKERIEYILSDTQAQFIITQKELTNIINSTTRKVVTLDSTNQQKELAKYPNSNPKAINEGKDVFNIIYTSGSTGEPKGVMVPHRGIINRLQWMQHEYQLDSSDIILQKTPFNFDVSVWELFWPLINGAQIFYAKPEGHKDPDYLRDIIKQKNISILHFVPSMLGAFLQCENIENCTNIKKIFTSGEALQIEHSKAFFDRLGFAELHNLYGPTEASIDVSYYPCNKNEIHNTVPIGKPIHNTQLLILDENLNLLPKGATGELYIGGLNLALGYLNKKELSENSFIDNPFLNHGLRSKKLYKTGDIARYLLDGNIEYLGRSDHQVKIRGLRIELSEIEQQIRKIKGVKEAVVITVDINHQTQIIAFVQGLDEIDKNAYHHLLQQQLPEYMLPFAYIVIDDIPLSANGKIDRKQLPLEKVSALTRSRQDSFVAPRNETEEQLQKIWHEILQADNIGIHDNFFELGGHSLLATRLASRIRSEFICPLELKAIFDNPTIADQSVFILEQAIETLAINDDDLLQLLDEIDDEL